MTEPQSVLQQLMQVILERKANPAARSYTAQLLTGGVGKIVAKVLEEASEVVEAAGEEGRAGQQHLVQESADLVYHLLVLLAARDELWESVERELAGRFGISGLTEKASRSSAPQPAASPSSEPPSGL